MLFSALDIFFVTFLATKGVLMAPLPPQIVVAVLAASAVFAVALDQLKGVVSRGLGIA